jgi:hypothetical protein
MVSPSYFVKVSCGKPRQGDVAAALGLLRSGAVGFIDWLDAAAQGAMDEAPALGEVVPSVWASDLVLMLP